VTKGDVMGQNAPFAKVVCIKSLIWNEVLKGGWYHSKFDKINGPFPTESGANDDYVYSIYRA
jgi:hypothetical protein